MNSFVKGMLVGVGVGLLVAPMKGEELRQLLRERFEELRANLPENEQLSMYAQQVSDRVSQTTGTLKDLAQQASSQVSSTASNLKDLAQQAGTQVQSTATSLKGTTQQAASEVKQAGQDVADTTKQAAQSAKQNA